MRCNGGMAGRPARAKCKQNTKYILSASIAHVFVLKWWENRSKIGTRGWELRKKGKTQKLFLVLSPRPGPDGPNASGWYRRLREPISPLSLLNCDQL